MSELYIAHHGILGQRWGKRNGPPYPLGASDHSASEKKAGWKKSLDATSFEGDNSDGFHLSDSQKRAIKIGAGLAVAGLAVYGTYKLKQSGVLDQYIGRGKDIAQNIIGDKAAGAGEAVANEAKSTVREGTTGLFNQDRAKAIAEQTGFALKSQANTLAENVAKANPGYKGGPTDPLRNNCSHSVISWVLNEIGLDVKALPMNNDEIDGGITPSEFRRYFKGCQFSSTVLPVGKTELQLKQYLATQIKNAYNGENSAGTFRMSTLFGGHYMGWFMTEGKVSFVDPQPGVTNATLAFSRMASGRISDHEIDFARLDNLDVRLPYIKQAVTNA